MGSLVLFDLMGGVALVLWGPAHGPERHSKGFRA